MTDFAPGAADAAAPACDAAEAAGAAAGVTDFAPGAADATNFARGAADAPAAAGVRLTGLARGTAADAAAPATGAVDFAAGAAAFALLAGELLGSTVDSVGAAAKSAASVFCLATASSASRNS